MNVNDILNKFIMARIQHEQVSLTLDGIYEYVHICRYRFSFDPSHKSFRNVKMPYGERCSSN